LAIFNIQSKRYLAFVLKTQLPLLKDISRNPNNFYRFKVKEIVKNEKLKIRRIEEPNSILKPIHKQIHNLISQLPAPDYLFSKKKSSCVLNAKVHSLAKGKTLNIDIENFFPSTAKWKVQNFFGYYLQYNRDVAAFFADICTVDGHIPTGSPLSLMLAFWANQPMFNELNKLSKSRQITMTIYVDDISFTGEAVSEKFKNKVIEIVNKHHHTVNADKVRFFGKDLKFINGIAIVNNQLEPSNELSGKVRNLKKSKEIQYIKNLNGKIGYIKYIKKVDSLNRDITTECK